MRKDSKKNKATKKDNISMKVATMAMAGAMVGTSVPCAPLVASAVSAKKAVPSLSYGLNSTAMPTPAVVAKAAMPTEDDTFYLKYEDSDSLITLEGSDTVYGLMKRLLVDDDVFGTSISEGMLKLLQIGKVADSSDAYVSLALANNEPDLIDKEGTSICSFYQTLANEQDDNMDLAVLDDSGSLNGVCNFNVFPHPENEDSYIIEFAFPEMAPEGEINMHYDFAGGIYMDDKGDYEFEKHETLDVKQKAKKMWANAKDYKPTSTEGVFSHWQVSADGVEPFDILDEHSCMYFLKPVTLTAQYVSNSTARDMNYTVKDEKGTTLHTASVFSDKVGVHYEDDDTTGEPINDLAFLDEYGSGYELEFKSTKGDKYQIGGYTVNGHNDIIVTARKQYVLVTLDKHYANGELEDHVMSVSPLIGISNNKYLQSYESSEYALPTNVYSLEDTAYDKPISFRNVFTANMPLYDGTDLPTTYSVNGVEYPVSYVVYDDGSEEGEYFDVTFDSKGGLIGEDEVKVKSYEDGKPFGSLPTPVRDGYDFKGWYTSEDGSGSRLQASDVVTGEATYYAVWARGSVTVTFDSNSGYFVSGSDTVKVTMDTELGDKLPAVARSGYTFAGWLNEATGEEITAESVFTDGMPVKAIAQWKKVETTSDVTFDAQGGTLADGSETVTVDVETGSVLGVLPVPSNPGFKFVGWFDDPSEGSQVSASTTVSGDMTLYAYWMPVELSVVFDANGGKIVQGDNILDMPYGATISEFPEVTKAHHAFVGWFTAPDGGEQITADTEITETQTIYAQWSENTVSASFDAQGGTIKESNSDSYDVEVAEGSMLNTLPTVTKEGYVFLGWFTAADGGDKVSESTYVTDGATYYAQWSKNKVTVVFDANGGKLTSGEDYTQVVVNQELGKLPTVERNGYVFEGWFTSRDGGEAVTADTIVEGEMTIYARWKADTVTVTFDAGKGTLDAKDETCEIVRGTYLGTLPTPTLEGHTFIGWYTKDGVKINEVTKFDDDTALVAKYKETVSVNPVTSLKLNKTEMTVDYGEDLGLKVTYAPVDADNLPLTWTSSNEKVISVRDDGTFVYVGEGTAILTVSTTDGAKSASVIVHVNAPKLLVNKLAWNETRQEVVADEHALKLGYSYGPAGASNANFVFSSSNPDIIWIADDGKTWGYGDKTGDVVLTIATVDGSISAKTTVVVKEKQTVDPTPDDKVEHTLTLNRGDGSETKNTVIHGTNVKLPTLEREGFTFDGWYNVAGDKITEIVVNADVTVYGRWTEIEDNTVYHTVSFDAYNGTTLPSVKIVDGEVIGKLPVVERPGYTFKGWFTAIKGGKEVTSSTVVTKDMTIYAQYEEKTSEFHTLTLNGNGGYVYDAKENVALDTKLQEQTATWSSVSNYIPTRQNYTFLGYTDAKDGGQVVYDAKGNAVESDKYWVDGVFVGKEDLTVYAQWSRNEEKRTLSFDTRGGNPLESATYEQGSKVSVFPTPVRSGYDFLGWFSEATGGEALTSVTLDENVTVYAQWKKQEVPPTTAFIAFVTQCEDVELSTLTLDIGSTYRFQTLYRDGYTFDGWYTEKDGGDRVLEIVVAEDATFYAHWTKIGDTDEPDDKVEYYHIFLDYQYDELSDTIREEVGTAVTEFPAPARSGYTFDGWFTKAEGGELVTSYYDSKDTTLFAHWTKEEEPQEDVYFTLRYDTQGGNLLSDASVLDGTTVDVFPRPEREGYEFIGWFSTKEGGAPILSLTMAGDATIYAQWKEIEAEPEIPEEAETYVVTLDDQDGVLQSYTMEVGTPFEKFSTAKREGYEFLGWFTEKEGGEMVTSYAGDKDVTFYAQWKEIEVESETPDEDGDEEQYLYITLDGKEIKELTATLDGSYTLGYHVSPKQAVTWSSDNDDVIAVDKNDSRRFAFVGEGVATLTATAEDGQTASVVITIVGDKVDEEPEADKDVMMYSLNATMSDGVTKKRIESLAGNTSLTALAKAFGFDKVSTYTLSTKTVAETLLDEDATVEDVVKYAANEATYLIALDANGNAIGSVLVKHKDGTTYEAFFSKDASGTHDAPNSKPGTTKPNTSGSTESTKPGVSEDGKGEDVQTSDANLAAMLACMAGGALALFGTLFVWKRKTSNDSDSEE